MKKTTAFLICVTMMIAACKAVEVPQTVPVDDKQPPKVQTHAPIIGGVERVYIEDVKTPFHARIDTGAETSSIDVQNINLLNVTVKNGLLLIWLIVPMAKRAGLKNRLNAKLRSNVLTIKSNVML